MSETPEDTQYIIGGMAVSYGMLTQEDYEAWYYDHASNHAHVPFEQYLLEQGVLTQEQIDYLITATNTYYRSDVFPGAGQANNGMDTYAEAAPEQTLLDPVAPVSETAEPEIMEFGIEPATEEAPGEVPEATIMAPVQPVDLDDRAMPPPPPGTGEEEDAEDTGQGWGGDAGEAEQTMIEPVQPAPEPDGDTDADIVPEATIMAPVQPAPESDTDADADMAPEATIMAPVQPIEEADPAGGGFVPPDALQPVMPDEEDFEDTSQDWREEVEPAAGEIPADPDAGAEADPPSERQMIADGATLMDPVAPADIEPAGGEIPAGLDTGADEGAENPPTDRKVFAEGATLMDPVAPDTAGARDEVTGGETIVDPEGPVGREDLFGATVTDDPGATIQSPVELPGGESTGVTGQAEDVSHTDMTINEEPVSRAGSSTSVTMGTTGLPGQRMADGGTESENAIDRYEILDEVARGGMGVIYKARQKALNRMVALKVMLSGAMASENERKRFLREAEACAKLNHPNVIRVYEIGMFNENYFFSMDFIDGVPLNEYTARLGDDFKDSQKLEIMIKSLDAIHYGHSHGIVHRDLKPANIMMNQMDEPIVMDFGLVKTLQSEDEDELSILTATGAVMGTPHYMAPEQAAGHTKMIDVRTDVFAFGIIMYELFAGVRPFTGNNVNEIFNAIFNIDPESPLKIKPDIDWEIEAIILKALEKESEKRYQTAGEMKEDIERFVRGEPIQAKKISRWYYVKKKIKRHKMVFGLLVLIMLLLVGGGTWAGLAYYNQIQDQLNEARLAAQERKRQEGKIVELGAANDGLKAEIFKLMEDLDINEAKIKLADIGNNTEKIASILDETKVGARDREGVRGTWEKEYEEIKATIAREEAAINEKLSARLTVKGNDSLKKAQAVFARKQANKEELTQAQPNVADAKLKYRDAITRHSENEDARKGLFSACLLMSEIAIRTRDFNWMSDSNLDEAKNIARSDEEKKLLADLNKRYYEEKNEVGKYRKLLADGQAKFAQNKFHEAQTAFEAAREILKTEEVATEIKRCRFKIESGKAESLRERTEYFSAVSGFRVALNYVVDAEDKQRTEKLIIDMIDKGVAKRLGQIKALVKERKLNDAEKAVKRVLLLKKDPEALRLQVLIRNMKGVPPNMVLIREGEFLKGTAEKTIGNPTGKVTIDSYYISKFEVTNFQYKRFVDAEGYAKKEYWSDTGWSRIKEFVSVDKFAGPAFWLKGAYPKGDDDLPVNGISYYEAQAYTRWLSKKDNRKYDLPDEYQWEKAASWNPETNKRVTWPWGPRWNVGRGSFGTKVRKIGASQYDVSPWGCFDMGGNLHEWVRSVYATGKTGVFKGGSARLPEGMAKAMAQAAFRQVPLDGFRGERVGFRIVTYPFGTK